MTIPTDPSITGSSLRWARWRSISSRSPIVGTLRSPRRLEVGVATFLVLIVAIVAYNARATDRERNQALIVNIASRQRALAERYIKDVLIRARGIQAEPQADAEQLVHTANALLHGGTVQPVQGADTQITIPPVSRDWMVTAKLEQERRLIGRLLDVGQKFLLQDPGTDAYVATLQQLRVFGALVATTSNDAVGQMTLDAQRSLLRVVLVGIALGLVGALAAVGMGLLLRRAGQRQTAQFRALVHSSSDLITVVDAHGTVRYESPASERLLGYRVSDLVGSRLIDLVEGKDVPQVMAALDAVRAEPGRTHQVVYRRRTADGGRRDMESAVTNLAEEPIIRGIVLNSRDVTERRRTEEALHALESERAQLLDRTVQATEQERQRLAMELHDGPVQHLAALALKLERVGLALARPDSVDPEAMVEQVKGRLQAEVDGLRRIMRELRPPALDERGLAAALLDHLHAVQNQSGLECTVDSSVEHRLGQVHETILYRVAQEALTNVAKHANARHVWVTLRPTDGGVELEVRDDGVGFDHGVVADLAREGHFGLIGMRERLEMAGGRWEVARAPEGGTLVRSFLPDSGKVGDALPEFPKEVKSVPVPAD